MACRAASLVLLLAMAVHSGGAAQHQHQHQHRRLAQSTTKPPLPLNVSIAPPDLAYQGGTVELNVNSAGGAGLSIFANNDNGRVPSCTPPLAGQTVFTDEAGSFNSTCILDYLGVYSFNVAARKSGFDDSYAVAKINVTVFVPETDQRCGSPEFRTSNVVGMRKACTGCVNGAFFENERRGVRCERCCGACGNGECCRPESLPFIEGGCPFAPRALRYDRCERKLVCFRKAPPAAGGR